MNDIFNFYGDKRNNVHLLLYINIYNDKHDIFENYLLFMNQKIKNFIYFYYKLI